MILLLALLAVAGQAGGARADQPDPPDRDALPITRPQEPDSAAADTVGVFNPGNWDSVMAAYDRSFRTGQTRKVRPKVGARYTKTEGLHVEAGAAMRINKLRIPNVEARVGYDAARQHANGLAMLQYDIAGRERWLLELSGRDGVRPFGNHNPYGNTLLTLVGGYDARQYLRTRDVSAMIVRRYSEERHIAIGWIRTVQDSVPVLADLHLFGPDYWMKRNESAEHVVENGIRLRILRRPPYFGEPIRTGLMAMSEIVAYGGEFLGGTREYASGILDLWYTHAAHATDTWLLRGSGSLATGRAPQQAWPDLGGAAGLFAFPPRNLHLTDSSDVYATEPAEGQFIGVHRLILRGEYQWRKNPITNNGVRLLQKTALILVPLAEIGSVWGDPLTHPILEFNDLRAPRLSEIHWDLGFGLRKDIGYSGVLTQAEVDFVWPMGADTAPARITFRLSNNWLD
jgi:hypothetical protein